MRPLFRRGGVAARLLRGAPGADSGTHSHHGLEYTLVLQGGFTDVTGSYAPGDLQVMEAGDVPQPGGRSGRGLHQPGGHHRAADSSRQRLFGKMIRERHLLRLLKAAVPSKTLRRRFSGTAADAHGTSPSRQYRPEGLAHLSGHHDLWLSQMARLGAGRGGHAALHQARAGSAGSISSIPPTCIPMARRKRWWAGR